MTGAVFFIIPVFVDMMAQMNVAVPKGTQYLPFGLRLAPPAWRLCIRFGNKPDEFLPGAVLAGRYVSAGDGKSRPSCSH